MRFASDVGGTFTDLVVESGNGLWRIYKSPTTPADLMAGVMNALSAAAQDHGCCVRDMLGRGDIFLHGTTQPINAVLTGRTAKTALLTTQGHPDVLLLREGGRPDPFDHTRPYPEPYVPRSLTFEVPERIHASGEVALPLDRDRVLRIIDRIHQLDVEAVAVCLLWSIVNPAHELQIGEMLEKSLPGVPYTISHQLNPVAREYRRASSAAIDASLKPLMARYLQQLSSRLRAEGFAGRVLALTSQGGTANVEEVANNPIHLLNSGPSMAPVAGRAYARLESTEENVIVADTGGTTYDVSLVRGGRIPFTRETWIGEPFLGHMTGFSSVDIKSIGAGGGSIAWVDPAGVLHVGPRSMGSDPGPACYGRGGTEPTVTDAAVVLGYLDPEYFLGGTTKLDCAAAAGVIEQHLTAPLQLSVHEAAAAILAVGTENMVQAILEITVSQGIDPARATLVAGGGAAGFNSVLIARRLRCPVLIFPEAGATMSAAGALISELTSQYRRAFFTSTDAFDRESVNHLLEALRAQCLRFIQQEASGSSIQTIDLAVEARYRNQAWDLNIPLRVNRFSSAADVEGLVEDFHQAHKTVFGVEDRLSPVEVLSWSATARTGSRASVAGRWPAKAESSSDTRPRQVFFPELGFQQVTPYRLDAIPQNATMRGPAIIESPFTTVVIDAPCRFKRSAAGSLVVFPSGEPQPSGMIEPRYS